MNTLASKRPFHPQSPDAAGVVSWVHFGDLHMTKAGEQNHLDLAELVNEVNRAFADSVSFVFLPGDVADDGSRSAYAVVRGELDRLNLPWCAIIGDHDVYEKSLSTGCSELSLDQTRTERSGNDTDRHCACRSASDRRRQHRPDADAPPRHR
jgi:Icc protein